MIVQPIKTRIFKEGENLFSFICSYFKTIPEKSVIVVTSKIVSLAEGRTADFKSEKDKERLIKKESKVAIKTKYVWLTIKDDDFMASAGIDESNANGKLILLPKDSFKTAQILHKLLKNKYKIKKLGVLIVDSRTIPLRSGVVGMAIGYFGLKGIRDYEGKKDIFKRPFKFARTNIVDNLASASILVMGEGNERHPLAIIKEAPIVFSNKLDRKEIKIKLKDDIYKPLYRKF